MARIFVTHRMSVPREDGSSYDLKPGFREVPDDVLNHAHVKTANFADESDMDDATKAEAERLGAEFDAMNVGVLHNVPQSDVNYSGAADARAHIEGDFDRPAGEPGPGAAGVAARPDPMPEDGIGRRGPGRPRKEAVEPSVEPKPAEPHEPGAA